jgi:hypothetical protein
MIKVAEKASVENTLRNNSQDGKQWRMGNEQVDILIPAMKSATILVK